MRRLLLLRHAKAVPGEAGMRDHERPLDSRGREDTPRMGAYMARHGLVPDRVLVSTAQRTRETWELMAPELSPSPLAVFDERLYDAAPETILSVIKETGGAGHTLLVIGHNPGIHHVAMQLVATGDVDTRERLSEGLPTAGLVTLDFAFDAWSKLHPHAGRLGHFVTPGTLTAAMD